MRFLPELQSDLRDPGAHWDVGWWYPGHATPALERAALAEMLEIYGAACDRWSLKPHIRVYHTGLTVELADPNTWIFDDDCRWYVIGALTSEPPMGAVPEGVRMPRYGERQWDR